MPPIKIDPDSFNLGELEQAEILAEMPIGDVLSANSARGLIALVCVHMRRDNPDFTMDDARKLRPAVDFEVGADRPTKRGAARS